LVYGFCLEDAGVAAVGVQSEAVELGESLGAGMLVDGARIGLVESMTQLTAQTGDIRASAVTLRAAVANALARGSVLFLFSFLSSAIERLLWTVGDRPTAALLGRFARLHLTSWTPPSAVDVEAIDPDELAGIETEAAQLCIETACAIALDALDRIIATH